MRWSDRLLWCLTASGVFYGLCRTSTGTAQWVFGVMTVFFGVAGLLALIADVRGEPL